MAHRRPLVPQTLRELQSLAQRDDATPREEHRALLGALLIIAGELTKLRFVLDDANANTQKVLDVLLKQHAALLLDRTDPKK